MMIDQLEENLTLANYAEHMEEINRLARSRDASCRIRLADLLCGFPNPHAKNTLLALTEDASYLVQTSAIDSLSAFPGDDTLAAAMRLSASRHPLVRGYAYICAGMAGRSLGDEERAGLRNRLSAIRETDTFAKICLLEGLVHLGDETPAAGLIRMFSRCNYRNQCAILNSLSDVYPEISRSSQERIRRFCQELADRDMCAAVQEAYDRLIRISRHRLYTKTC